MPKLSDERVQELLEAAGESRRLEFKSGLDWRDPNSLWLRESIVRAILGMSNTPSGGQVIIGISEGPNHTPRPTGLTAAQLASFDDLERVQANVDSFTYDSILHTWEYGEHRGSYFVFVTVQEFLEIPTLCRINGDHIDGQGRRVLTENDLYVRSRKTPYSTKKATDLEMREIIRTAVDKSNSDLQKRGWLRAADVGSTDFYKAQASDLLDS